MSTVSNILWLLQVTEGGVSYSLGGRYGFVIGTYPFTKVDRYVFFLNIS